MNLFIQNLLEHRCLICSHRGFHMGNIVENSLEAIGLAYEAGAEIVEVDVARSKDGKYYLFHTGAEEQLYGIDTPFSELDSDFINSTPLRNSLGQSSGFTANSLKEVIDSLEEGQLLNIDRSWLYWENDFLQVLESYGKSEQLLLKSPPLEEYLNAIANSPFYYMPILDDPEDFPKCQEIVGDQVIGVEYIVQNAEEIDEDFIDSVHEQGIFLFSNTINLDGDTKLFGPWDDQASILNDEAEGWEGAMDHGADIIQTDWPHLLYEYRCAQEEEYFECIQHYSNTTNWKMPRADIKCIGVYGYALNDDASIHPILEQRLNTACTMAEMFPDAKVIVSGGMPVNGVPESEVMKNYMVEKEVDPDRIIQDSTAFDTVSNNRGILAQAMKLNSPNVLLVSSKLHIPRCLLGMEEMIQLHEADILSYVIYPTEDALPLLFTNQEEEVEYRKEEKIAIAIEETLSLRNLLWSRGLSTLRIFI